MIDTLANLNQPDRPVPLEERRQIISEVCVDLADQVVESAGHKSKGLSTGELRQTSFEQFGQWYTAGGYNDALWFELIDRSKWPRADAPSQPERNAVAALSESPTSVQFALKSDPQVTVDVADGKAVVDAARWTKLCNINVADVFEVVQRHACVANSSHALASPSAPFKMDKRGFNSTIQDLVPGDLLNEDQQRAVSTVLNNVFFAFDRANNAVVGADELALGLSLFCEGSKSEKLFEAFRLFLARAQAAASSPGGTSAGPAGVAASEGLLTRRAVWVLLRSFLTAIMALTRSATERPAHEMFQAIDQEVIAITSSMFRYTSKEHGLPNIRGLGFVEFGNWFNSVGFDQMQWVELLCLKAWPTTEGQCTTPPEAAEVASAAPSGETARYVLQVELHTQRRVANLRVSVRDVERLAKFLRCIDRSEFEVWHEISQCLL